MMLRSSQSDITSEEAKQCSLFLAAIAQYNPEMVVDLFRNVYPLFLQLRIPETEARREIRGRKRIVGLNGIFGVYVFPAAERGKRDFDPTWDAFALSSNEMHRSIAQAIDRWARRYSVMVTWMLDAAVDSLQARLPEENVKEETFRLEIHRPFIGLGPNDRTGPIKFPVFYPSPFEWQATAPTPREFQRDATAQYLRELADFVSKELIPFCGEHSIDDRREAKQEHFCWLALYQTTNKRVEDVCRHFGLPEEDYQKVTMAIRRVASRLQLNLREGPKGRPSSRKLTNR